MVIDTMPRRTKFVTDSEHITRDLLSVDRTEMHGSRASICLYQCCMFMLYARWLYASIYFDLATFR